MSAPRRVRLLLLIPHLGGGGAEHVIQTLARRLNPEKYEIHLGLITQAASKARDLPSWVVVHGLNGPRVRASSWKLLRLVWRVRPAVIFSGIAHLNLLVLLLQPLLPRKAKVIARQNGPLSAALASSAVPVRWLYRIAYRRAALIICQTHAMSTELYGELGVQPLKLQVLPNPVDIRNIRTNALRGERLWSGTGPNILAIGRLVPEKGFDMLVEAFSLLRPDFPRAQLVIAGTGPCESSLKDQCISLGIEKEVQFVGHLACPAEYFRNASAFVLSSREEGLPNALLEAAAAGLPIVSLSASRGVADLLHGKEGVWLSDKLSIDALENVLRSALSALRPLERFDHGWIREFDLEPAIRCYENAIDGVLAAVRT